jgi:hypothetical protein
MSSMRGSNLPVHPLIANVAGAFDPTIAAQGNSGYPD